MTLRYEVKCDFCKATIFQSIDEVPEGWTEILCKASFKVGDSEDVFFHACPLHSKKLGLGDLREEEADTEGCLLKSLEEIIKRSTNE